MSRSWCPLPLFPGDGHARVQRPTIRRSSCVRPDALPGCSRSTHEHGQRRCCAASQGLGSYRGSARGRLLVGPALPSPARGGKLVFAFTPPACTHGGRARSRAPRQECQLQLRVVRGMPCAGAASSGGCSSGFGVDSDDEDAAGDNARGLAFAPNTHGCPPPLLVTHVVCLTRRRTSILMGRVGRAAPPSCTRRCVAS